MTDKTRKRHGTAHPRDISPELLINDALAVAAQYLKEHAAVLAVRSPNGCGADALRARAQQMETLLDSRT